MGWETTLIIMGIAGAAVGGAAAGGAFSGKPKVPGMPDITEKVPETTTEELESQEKGWEEVTRRAAGRRATILTQPSLEQISPYTRRATLLSG